MSDDREDRPHYTRYRARPRLLRGEDDGATGAARVGTPPPPGQRPRAHLDAHAPRDGGARGRRWRNWRRWTRPKRILLSLLALAVGWVVLSLILFLVSSHF
jgi:hypothetical protein